MNPRRLWLLFVSRLAPRNSRLYTCHLMKRAYLSWDREARGIICSDRISSRCYSELLFRTARHILPNDSLVMYDLDIDTFMYAPYKSSWVPTVVFRPNCKIEEWSIAYLHSKLCYCVAWETGLPICVAGSGYKLCLLRKSGQIPVYTVTKRTT